MRGRDLMRNGVCVETKELFIKEEESVFYSHRSQIET